MELKIETGKYYRTRDGRKVGPMQANTEDNPAEYGPWKAPREDWMTFNPIWHQCGSFWHNKETDKDLIAELKDEQSPEQPSPANTKPYLAPFKPNQRITLEPIANGGWLVSAASPFYGQEQERLGAFGSAGDMLSALHDALTVRKVDA